MIYFHQENQHDDKYDRCLEVRDVERASKTAYVRVRENNSHYKTGSQLHTQPINQTCHHSSTTYNSLVSKYITRYSIQLVLPINGYIY